LEWSWQRIVTANRIIAFSSSALLTLNALYLPLLLLSATRDNTILISPAELVLKELSSTKTALGTQQQLIMLLKMAIEGFFIVSLSYKLGKYISDATGMETRGTNVNVGRTPSHSKPPHASLVLALWILSELLAADLLRAFLIGPGTTSFLLASTITLPVVLFILFLLLLLHDADKDAWKAIQSLLHLAWRLSNSPAYNRAPLRLFKRLKSSLFIIFFGSYFVQPLLSWSLPLLFFVAYVFTSAVIIFNSTTPTDHTLQLALLILELLLLYPLSYLIALLIHNLNLIMYSPPIIRSQHYSSIIDTSSTSTRRDENTADILLTTSLITILLSILLVPLVPLSSNKHYDVMTTIAHIGGYVILSLTLFFYLGVSLQAARATSLGIDIGYIGFMNMLVEGCYPNPSCMAKIILRHLGVVFLTLILFTSTLIRLPTSSELFSISGLVDVLLTWYIINLRRLYIETHAEISSRAEEIFQKYLEDSLEASKPDYMVVGYGANGQLITLHMLAFSSIPREISVGSSEPMGFVLVPSAAVPERPVARNFDPALTNESLLVVEKDPVRITNAGQYLGFIKVTSQYIPGVISPTPAEPYISLFLRSSATIIPALNMDASDINLSNLVAKLPYMSVLITVPDESESVRVLRNIRIISSLKLAQEPSPQPRTMPWQILIPYYDSAKKLVRFSTSSMAIVTRFERCQLSQQYPPLPPGLEHVPSNISVISDCYAAWSLGTRIGSYL